MLWDNEPVEKPPDVVKSATIKGGHSMTLRSHKNSSLQMNTANEAPKEDVMIDGKKKVTGNTQVQRITLEEGLSVVEEEQKEMLRDSINNELINALFIFNTSLNSDPGEPRTDEEALNGPETDWWIPACIAEMNNFLNRKS